MEYTGLAKFIKKLKTWSSNGIHVGAAPPSPETKFRRPYFGADEVA